MTPRQLCELRRAPNYSEPQFPSEMEVIARSCLYHTQCCCEHQMRACWGLPVGQCHTNVQSSSHQKMLGIKALQELLLMLLQKPEAASQQQCRPSAGDCSRVHTHSEAAKEMPGKMASPGSSLDLNCGRHRSTLVCTFAVTNQQSHPHSLLHPLPI